MAVIGCGSGHDARLFAQHGFETIGFDISPTALAVASRLSEGSGLPVSFERADFFELPTRYPAWFDVVVEHSFFTAIDPSQRPAYVEVVAAILRPGGELIGLFREHDRPGGPPHGTSTDELRALFGRRFDVERLEPTDRSIDHRRGEELLARLRRRPE